MKSEEVIIINDEPFYRVQNGTSYDYAPIPKQFKPYFDKLQQENQRLKSNRNKLKEWLEENITNDKCCTDLITHCLSVQDLIDEKQYILEKLQEIEGYNE